MPALVEMQLAGQRLVMTHGHQPGLLGFFLKGLDVIAHWMKLTDNAQLNRRMVGRLARLYPDADIIVFGHSHRAHVERIGRALLVNPGAVSASPGEEPTVARMCLGVDPLDVEIIPLPH